jgi:hypothetical protein
LRQFMEQAPGPRGSPHCPQPPADGIRVAAAPWPVCAAKAENCRSSALLWHDGHDGVSAPRTRVSKRR